MSSKYVKNYTDKGYLMSYNRPQVAPLFKSLVLQFKIALDEIKPEIWRRIQVPSDYNFWDLHVAIQDSMGWLDYHLHHFDIRPKRKQKTYRIGIPDFEGTADLEEVYPGWEISVMEYFNVPGIEAKYEYDYGDSWVHNVKLEGYIYKEKGLKYPHCLDGERACPPEDCGGIPGYNNLVKILSDRKHPEYKEIRRWLGDKWMPDHFNREDVKFDNPYKRWEYAFLNEGNNPG